MSAVHTFQPYSRLLAVLGLLAICMGSNSSGSCTFGGGSRDDDDGDGDGGGAPSFVTQLVVQEVSGPITDTFERGELIELVLTVRNRLDTDVEVDFPTTRTSDFVVLHENTDDVVWKWSDDQPPFQQIPTTLQFAAGETQTFRVIWNQIGSNGTQVRTGAYEARGVLVFSGFDSDPLRTNQMGSELERFTVN